MLESLLKLFERHQSMPDGYDEQFEDDLASVFGLKPIQFYMPSTIGDYSFKTKDDGYEFSMAVGLKATSDNVKIDLDKNNNLSVKYSFKDDNSEHITSIKRTLPKDADLDTLDAEIRHGQLIITVKRNA